MTRGEAVSQILGGLGNRTGSVVTARAQTQLQIAQAELEQGKTLPDFLAVEDEALVLPAGSSFLPLPTGFIRFKTRPHFFDTNNDGEPFFLNPKEYEAALAAIRSGSATSLEVFVIRKGNGTIDFINPATETVNLVWSYYKKADVLTIDGQTNQWLSDPAGANWLIGEAGWRAAMLGRDGDAVKLFDMLRTSGRAACFGEILASEDNSGPYVMGANL